MVLTVLLLFLPFVVGPTVFILNTLFVGSLGGYVAALIPMSFRTAALTRPSASQRPWDVSGGGVARALGRT